MQRLSDFLFLGGSFFSSEGWPCLGPWLRLAPTICHSTDLLFSMSHGPLVPGLLGPRRLSTQPLDSRKSSDVRFLFSFTAANTTGGLFLPNSPAI